MFRCESLKNGHYSYCEMRMVQVQLVPQRRKTQHGAMCVTGKAVGMVWGTIASGSSSWVLFHLSLVSPLLLVAISRAVLPKLEPPNYLEGFLSPTSRDF